MQRDYSKFLSAKLYLIEQLSLKGMLAGDDLMKEIHSICIASFQTMQDKLDNLDLR
jgi:hypothetical protein